LQKSIFEQSISGTQKGRGSETSYKFKKSKSLCNVSTFQNGRSLHGQRPSSKRRLPNQNRFERRIFCDVNKSNSQEIFEISDRGREYFRVHCPTVRSGGSPPPVHKDTKTCNRSLEKIRHKDDRLLRRHSVNGRKSTKVDLSQGFHTIPTPKAGICNKLEKIGVKTITRNRVPWVSNKFARYDVLSARNQDRKYKTKLQTLAETGKNYCERTGKVNRETFIFNAGNNSSLLTKSFPSNGSDKGPINGEVLRTRNMPLRRGKTRTVLVGHPDRQLQWENYNNPKSRSRYNLRRLKFRLGGDVSRSKHRGSLVQRRVKFAYKRKRTTGSFPSYTDLYKRVHSFGNSFKTRQYVSGQLCQQVRGNEIERSKYINEKDLAMVSGQENMSDCRTPSGNPECHSRLVLPECERLERLGTRSRHFSPNTEISGESRGGPVCLETESPTGQICQLETRPNELGNGRLSTVLERNTGVCLPTICNDREMSGKNNERQSDIDINSSHLAGPALVPTDITNVDSGSNTASQLPGTSEVPIGGNTSINPDRVTESRGMDNFGTNPFATKLSRAAATLHEKAWRPGTQIAYKSSWGKWCGWCNKQSLNPFHTTVANIVEFFTDLFNQGLQYRTINTYRSAISKNHSLIDNLQVGKHPLVIRHMRAIFNQRTPTSKYQFTWDVDTVLNEILSWGDNDVLTIKLLTWKLVMLLALASAGRSSELSLLNCNCMKQQGSFIYFELPKHTKTCRPGLDNRKITFEAFKENSTLCIVNCINDYIKHTQIWRKCDDNIDRSWLLLSLVKPHHSVTPSTVARWLKETIKKSGISDLFKAHSTRSASSSKAKRVGLSTKDIVEQAKWTNESTFMKFYSKPLDSIGYQQAVLSR